MARKTIKDRRADALAGLEAAKAKLVELEDAEAKRIGKLAIKAGLTDADISDEQLAKEFAAIAAKFSGSKTGSSAGGKASGNAG
ncbi:hypothetical protein R75465_07415 [Paraburkholderia aspalathi]|uniref:TraC family protein n=1 Tax=Paraburkholderia aspalathi TaxID=1324617 RepID=UPI001B237FC1|nr:TraC family protein [Paraburkholderia aspalathi]CAE6856007.1 hypothetical protein R75465_07415 [Paraburkholderia aspalathi]